MQKHLVTAKPNERATQSARPSGNEWPKGEWQVWSKQTRETAVRAALTDQ